LCVTAVLAAACRDQAPALEALYAKAELDVANGRLPAAERAVQQLLRSAAAPELAWRSRALGAEAALDRDAVDAAEALLAAGSPPDTAGGALQARLDKIRGEIAFRRGDQPQALKRLSRAAALAPADPGRPLTLEILARLGYFHAVTGARAEGLAMLQRTVDLAALHPRWRAAALNSRGYLELRDERCPAALPHLERALVDARAAAAPAMVARVQLNLGICLAELRDFEGARPRLDEAAAIFQALGANGALQNALGSLANYHLLAGEQAEAIALYERALALARLHDPGATSRWALNLAVAYAEQRRWRLATRYNDEVRRLMAAAGDRGPNLLLTWNEARVAEGEQDLARAERGYLDVAAASAHYLELLWDSEGRLANLYQRLGRKQQAGSFFARSLASADRLRREVRVLDHQLNFVERLVALHHDHTRWLLGQGKTAEALVAYEASRVKILSERLGRATPDAAAPVEDLRRKARARGEILISYMLDERGSFAWVVDRQAVRGVALPPQPEITRAAEAYRRFIDDSLRDPRQVEDSPAQALYRMVLAPLLAGVPAGSHVTVAPDGALHGVPLGALVIPADGRGGRARFVIEDLTLALAPSLMTLPDRPPAGGLQAGTGALVAIGDPPELGPEFPRLPSAGDELAALERLFAGHPRLISRGADARPEVYRRPELATARLVHFATHAIASPLRPLDSSILLARGPGGDRLSVRDILGIPLQADLVTISACRSAGARPYHAEGLVGLTWAFLTAGARHVVAGLWDVPDRSTGALMQRMYGELARGARPAEALRAAQLGLAQGAGAWATPFYWAAFQVYAGGEPAALTLSAPGGPREKNRRIPL
jgi:CHAT domain-containing protein